MFLEISFKLSNKKASGTGVNQVLKLACENIVFTLQRLFVRDATFNNDDGCVGGITVINGESGIVDVHFCCAQMPLGKA